jgi:hypothetical protein
MNERYKDFSPVLARLVSADPRPKIIYFIPHEPQDLSRSSPFGFYSPAIHRSAEMFMSACQLPGDIREPFTTPSNLFHWRLMRALWRQVVPIDIRALQRAASAKLPVLFRVVFTNSADVAKTVDALKFADNIPFLHVSSLEGSGRKLSEQLNVSGILEFVELVLSHLL